MRSPNPSPRRPCRPSADPHQHLEAMARLVDEQSTDEPRHLLLHLVAGVEEVELGVRPLPAGGHPFPALAGLSAPSEWTAVGVRAVGTAHHLDHPGRPPQRIATTLFVDRDGRDVSLLRTGDDVQVLRSASQGTIPDACRRVLGLSTAPPPPTTAVLWTLVWLDRLMEAWARPLDRRRLTSSWEEVARHHPAVEHLPAAGPASLADPTALVAIAAEHVRFWPWARLRHHPEVLNHPDGDLGVEVTTWMDDGFFARWTLGGYPSLQALATDLPALLGEPLGPQLVRTALALLA